MDTRKNKVAFGMVFSEEEMNGLIHGVRMPPGCIRVSVDGAIQPDALLPVPVRGEMEKVHQAVGSQVAWPLDLVIYPDVPVAVCISYYIFYHRKFLFLFLFIIMGNKLC